MRWGLLSHLAMWAVMAFMAWDMWMIPHPVVVVGSCSSGTQSAQIVGDK